MTHRTLIYRSLRYYWRSHLGVVLGAAVGSAALVGALVVGDSVKLTLRERALERLAGADLALDAGDRFFEQSLADRLHAQYSIPIGLVTNAGVTAVSVFAAASNATNQRTSDSFVPVATNFITNMVGPRTVLRSDRRATPLLRLPGMAARQDGTARANQIQVWGVADFWTFARPPEVAGSPQRSEQWRFSTALPPDSVLLNEALAAQLQAKAGDAIILRIHKPSALSRDAVITPRDDASIALRLTVNGVVSSEQFGDLRLNAGQTPPLNAFVQINELGAAAGVAGRANVLLATSMRRQSPAMLNELKRTVNRWLARISPRLRLAVRSTVERAGTDEQREASRQALRKALRPEDLELNLRLTEGRDFVELNTRRIFLEEPIVAAATTAQSAGILTYLANLIRRGTNVVPYSMITAAGAPWTPTDMREDEILLNQWLADDLGAGKGDLVEVSYYLADSGSRLIERTNRFRVRGIVPMTGVYRDRSLMPEFPGLAKAESTHDWDAGFPLEHKIRDVDEAYWKQYRGTPKAFITLPAGQSMWSNRFGNLTSIRWPAPEGVSPAVFRGRIEQNLMANLDPAQSSLRFEAVRDQALASADQAQNFGGLFLGFSFFLIAAALILMALLFQFALEQRTGEVGTLLALGFTGKQVRRFAADRARGQCAGFGGHTGGGTAPAGAAASARASRRRKRFRGSRFEFNVQGRPLAHRAGHVGRSGFFRPGRLVVDDRGHGESGRILRCRRAAADRRAGWLRGPARCFGRER
jgi:hypothetical protein